VSLDGFVEDTDGSWLAAGLADESRVDEVGARTTLRFRVPPAAHPLHR